MTSTNIPPTSQVVEIVKTGGSPWEIAFALADTVPDPTPKGAIAELAERLEKQGTPRSTTYLSDLLAMGRYVPQRNRKAVEETLSTTKVLRVKEGTHLTYSQATKLGWFTKAGEMTEKALVAEMRAARKPVKKVAAKPKAKAAAKPKPKRKAKAKTTPKK
jgi:uncharacterized protein with von Willebrand factor type A (vWA) domain